MFGTVMSIGGYLPLGWILEGPSDANIQGYNPIRIVGNRKHIDVDVVEVVS